MAPRNHALLGRVGAAAGLLLALLLLAAPAVAADFPASTLRPKGDFTAMIDEVWRVELFWGVVVFVLVEGALIYTILRFRGRPDDPEPEQTHGNTTAEIIWTVIPALILAMIAVPTVRTIFKTYEVPAGDALEVEVVGHQWWWEFRYPALGITTANELHVPTNTTVTLRMSTQDVLHSFWSPQLAAKRDVFPNRTTTLWFNAREEGNYAGQCAEFCGIQHGRMGFRIVAESPETFEAYTRTLLAGRPTVVAGDDATLVTTAGAQAPGAPAADPLVAEGEKLFMMKACMGCHSLDATKPMGMGPNLAGIGSRSHLAGGWLANTDANLAAWIQRPDSVKEGVLMPNLQVTDDEARALVAYLRRHR